MDETKAFWMTHGVSVGDEIDSIDWTTRLKGYMQKTPIANIVNNKLQFIGDIAGQALFEMAFEMIRLDQFPQLPSRLHSIFLWPSRSDAQQYHSGVNYAEIYEVSLIEIRNLFIGDYWLVTNYPSPFTVEGFKHKAVQYWSGVSSDRKKEIVLDGKVRVVAKCV